MENNLGNKKTMSSNISYYMARDNVTRKELAELTGAPYTTVCDWINAKTYPRIDKIEKMAQIFGISKADLVEEKPDAKNSTRLNECVRMFNSMDPQLQDEFLEYMRYRTNLKGSDK